MTKKKSSERTLSNIFNYFRILKCQTTGLSLILIHLVCIRLTGTSVNPARSIGPALFAGGQALKDLWVFIVAPLCGGALSAVVWSALAPAADEK